MLKRLLLSGVAVFAFSPFALAQTAPDASAPPAAASSEAVPGETPVDASAAYSDPNLYSNMTGASVVGENDENIGSVADMLIDNSGELKSIIISHGGLIGIGQTYRQYDVSSAPVIADKTLRLGDLSTASLEGIPEYTYPTAEGRAATNALPAGMEPEPAPAAAPANAMWPASNLVGATIQNGDNSVTVSDLRFEGNKVAAVLFDKGSLGLGNDVAEVAFSDVTIAGTPAEPVLTLASAPAPSPNLATDTPPAATDAPPASMDTVPPAETAPAAP